MWWVCEILAACLRVCEETENLALDCLSSFFCLRVGKERAREGIGYFRVEPPCVNPNPAWNRKCLFIQEVYIYKPCPAPSNREELQHSKQWVTFRALILQFYFIKVKKLFTLVTLQPNNVPFLHVHRPLHFFYDILIFSFSIIVTISNHELIKRLRARQSIIRFTF